MVVWTHVIAAWMYATRLPAMKRARLKPDPEAKRGDQMSTLPARVRWKADNYNNLLEQPTLFYAIVIVLALLGQNTAFNIGVAWAYVGLRVAHSLVQVLVNKIELRFSLFVLSALVLVVLTARAVGAVI